MSASLVAALAFAGNAQADLNDRKHSIDRQLDSAKDDLHDTSVELQHAYAALSSTRSKIPGAQNALTAATDAATAADERNQQAIADLEAARTELTRTETGLSTARSAIEDRREQVAGIAAQMYQDQGFGAIGIALDSGDPNDVANRLAMADTVMGLQNDAIDSLSATAADLTAQQQHLRALKEKVATLHQQTEAALADANAARDAAATAKANLDSLVAEQERDTATLQVQKTTEAARIAELSKESDSLTAQLAEIARREKLAAARKLAAQRADRGTSSNRTPPAASNPAPSTGGFLSAPSAGWISSEFGYRYHPILHYSRLHAGRDYAAACGTPVYAAAPGTIVSASYDGGYGNHIVISHGIQRGVSLATTYNHLSAFKVTSGSVARGQLIGLVGTTGLSTGCHLHFETRENGVPVDPRRWL